MLTHLGRKLLFIYKICSISDLKSQTLYSLIMIILTEITFKMTEQQPHDKIFNILFQEDELTWQNIIYDLVRSEEMDAWDIDISMIAQKFLERLKALKDMDFRISGKVVLASSILLKMKSTRLLEQDLTAFDSLLAASEDEQMDLLEELTEGFSDGKESVRKIRPKTPQPRKRKV